MKKFLVLSVLAIMSAAPAFAQDEPPPPPPGEGGPRGEKMLDRLFSEEDKNGDGTISKEEYVQAAEARFTKLDSDGNGQLSKEEIKSHHQGKREKMKSFKGKRDMMKEEQVQ
jgi:hypothetical protein